MDPTIYGPAGEYNPNTDTWTPINTTNAPGARSAHTAVWTGSQMIIWGGSGNNNNPLNTGGKYNPGTNSWLATSTTNAPAARYSHTAVWTGSEMIVWGGVSSGDRGGTPVEDTIQARIVGRLLAPVMPLILDIIRQQCGPELR